MNTDTTYLPQNKRDDLKRIVAIVRKHCKEAGMIILYGSYARGDYKELKDLAPDRKSGHPSDYDILAIVGKEGNCGTLAWQWIVEDCTEARLSATPRFIYHDLDYINSKLEIGQYFFSDIINEGRLIYDAGKMELAQRRELTHQERLRIAQDDFNQWYQNSQQFFDNHKFNCKKGWLKLAAFHLHQAAESAYKTALIVFTGYIPDEHYLFILGAQASEIDPGFETQTIFKADTDFERKAFNALEYAYIGARYDKEYTIDKKTITYLAKRVTALMQLTEERCNEKLAALHKTAG